MCRGPVDFLLPTFVALRCQAARKGSSPIELPAYLRNGTLSAQRIIQIAMKTQVSVSFQN